MFWIRILEISKNWSLSGLNKVVAGILKGVGSARHGMMILRLRLAAAFCFWNLSFPLLFSNWISINLGGYLYRWDFSARLSFLASLSFGFVC
jgi:hypothetical protein